MLKVLTKADWDESEHPRDEDGKFAFGGGGGDGGDSDTVTVVDHPGQGYSKEARIKDGKIYTSDVYDAARALHENRKVELDQPRTLSTLIDHLGKIGNEMKRQGKDAPNYNLCNVSIKGTNLFCAGSKDIPRPEMPQLSTEQTLKFREHLKRLGYKEVEASERSDFLRATQRELNGVKVARVAGELRTQTWPQEKRLIVSRDNYILDGHHLWAAQIANDAEDGVLGDAKTDIARVDIDIITLMDEAKNFGAGYESQNIAVSSGYGPERQMASATPEQFVAARSESGRAAFLSDKSADELKSDSLFLSRDGHTGYALDSKSDLQNLFNNGPKGGGKVALVDAIKNGAETLDAFDSFLPRLYAAHGFVVTGRIKFNDEFAPAGWDYAKDGRPDVVFMRYAGGDRETIEDRIGKFEPYDRSQGSYFTDYDSAKAASRSAGVGKGLVHGLPQLGGGRAEHGGRRQFSEELESPHGRSEETGKRLRVEDSPRRIYVRSSLVEAHRLISKIEASGDIEIVPYDGDYIPGTELIDLSEWEERDFDESKHPRDEHGRWTDGGGGGDGPDSDEGGGREIAVSTGKSDADLPETQMLLAASEIDVGDITDVTDYAVEGTAGFLTPAGRILDVGPLSHATAAEDAGTSVEAVMQEGTARIYVSGEFLGIEIAKPPTSDQVGQLIKLAKAGDFERFVVETPGQGVSKLFEGLVTAKEIRNTIDEAFRPKEIHETPGPESTDIAETAPQPFIASTNIFTTRFAKVKDQVGFGKSDKGGARVTWTQKGSAVAIAEHAREAVVQLGGTNREYAALVGKAHSLPSKVSLIEGSKHSVPLGNQAEIMLTTTGQTFDLYHNHPYPYPLSMPDLGYLNNNPTLISIREDDVDGAYTSATIPGREHLSNKVPAWTNWNRTIATYENSVIAEHMKGPLREVINDLKNKMANDMMTAEEGNHVMNFIGQWAQVIALDKVGIIKLEYKLSDWQQKQLDTYPKQFKEASKIALARARLAKNRMKMVNLAGDPYLG